MAQKQTHRSMEQNRELRNKPMDLLSIYKTGGKNIQWGKGGLFDKNFCGGSDGKESACNMGDPGLIPGLGRSPGEGNGYPLQYSCLKNSMDTEAWKATIHGITKSQTQLSD